MKLAALLLVTISGSSVGFDRRMPSMEICQRAAANYLRQGASAADCVLIHKSK